MNQIPSKLSPVVAVGIATLLGMSVYSMRTAHSSTSNKAQDKRELGLRGAGIGGNKNAGGPEFGTNSVERKEQTTAPKSELPSGGVGGGEGKGGTSARAVELHTRERSQVNSTTRSDTADRIIDSVRHIFGQTSGAATDTSDGVQSDAGPRGRRHDTKVASKTGSETPSKHGPQ